MQVDNLKVSYALTRALQGFSLEIEAGQAIAVLGANGAGKTLGVSDSAEKRNYAEAKTYRVKKRWR